jgi:DNA replicative helicase MCM subunit Mcm2 (Cdc46/Mcm family)
MSDNPLSKGMTADSAPGAAPPEPGRLSDLQRVSPEAAERFKTLSRGETDAADELWQSVAPSMTARRRAREATLYALASEADRNGQRGRIHVFLYGPGGTGKTVIRDWVKTAFPDAVSTGPGASEAGLQVNGNTGKLGKLPQSHGGVLCLEELDKFDKNDREALYESMSEGYFEVDKGGIDADIPAASRVIAVGNDPTRLGDALRTRFDFSLEVSDYDADETVEVATDQYDTFRERFVRDSGPSEDPFLPQYLALCGDYRPTIPDGTLEAIADDLERLVRDHDLTGAIREKLAYLRVAYVRAKLDCRAVAPRDWRRAIELIHPDVTL